MSVQTIEAEAVEIATDTAQAVNPVCDLTTIFASQGNIRNAPDWPGPGRVPRAASKPVAEKRLAVLTKRLHGRSDGTMPPLRPATAAEIAEWTSGTPAGEIDRERDEARTLMLEAGRIRDYLARLALEEAEERRFEAQSRERAAQEALAIDQEKVNRLLAILADGVQPAERLAALVRDREAVIAAYEAREEIEAIYSRAEEAAAELGLEPPKRPRWTAPGEDAMRCCRALVGAGMKAKG